MQLYWDDLASFIPPGDWFAQHGSEQRPKGIPILHGLYVKPRSSRRLLNWFVVHCLQRTNAKAHRQYRMDSFLDN